jgi:hypothetical protein
VTMLVVVVHLVALSPDARRRTCARPVHKGLRLLGLARSRGRII